MFKDNSLLLRRNIPGYSSHSARTQDYFQNVSVFNILTATSQHLCGIQLITCPGIYRASSGQAGGRKFPCGNAI